MMYSFRYSLTAVVAAVACMCCNTSVMAQRPPDGNQPNKAVEKVNKALDMTLNFDFEQQPISALLDYIERQTQVRVAIDQTLGIDPMDLIINLRERNITVRSALRKALAQSRLTIVVEEDGILISDEMLILNRQFNRRISVDLKDVPAGTEIRKLARSSNINLVIDPRASKQAQSKVSLSLDEVPVETVIKLLADLADLQCVRLSNVLYITTPERAQRFIHEQSPMPFQNGFTGFGPINFGNGIGFGFGGGAGGFGGGNGFGMPGRPPVPIEPPIPPPGQPEDMQQGLPQVPPAIKPVRPAQPERPAQPALQSVQPRNPEAPTRNRDR